MRRRRAAGIALIAALSVSSAGSAGSFETTVLQTPSGATLELTLRAWRPGEAVLVRLTDRREGVRTFLRFQGRSVPVEAREGREPGRAFFGLDLALEPGVYNLEIEDRPEDGEPLRARRTVEIQPRVFPRKSLRVNPEYVIFPPGVEERVRREAELLGTIYGIRSAVWQGEGAFLAPHPAKPLPNFGELRVYNGVPRSPHSGVDLEAGPNEVVRAANAGTVVLASELYLAGNTVVLDHGLGVFTYYCHFSRLLVKRGEAVAKGAPIGRVGSTGRSTGPHLHWGVRIFDARVDPASLLGLEE